MKLSVDLSALHKAIAPLGKVSVDFNVTSKSVQLESIATGLAKGKILGVDIQLDQIDSLNGILNFEGNQVMLYIPDQGDDIEFVLKDGKEGRKVHVAECTTLEFMRETGRFKRYDVISRVDGLFPVFGNAGYSNQETAGEADLGVCKNCLKVLNYKGYASKLNADKRLVFNDFKYQQFFEVYSSYFKSLPESSSTDKCQSNQYTADWPLISSKLRSELNYTCQQCGVALNDHKSLLHVHHINGLKADNRSENLTVVCCDCHKKQPHHGHLYVSNEDTLQINGLRREQHKFDVFNYSELSNYADSALDGLIHKCNSRKVACGELGLSVKVGNNSVSIDICWPRKKVAVLIDMVNAHHLQKQGWTVFSAFDALSEFEKFQSAVR